MSEKLKSAEVKALASECRGHAKSFRLANHALPQAVVLEQAASVLEALDRANEHAATDERDRLFELAHAESLTGCVYEAAWVRDWLGRPGGKRAMLPAARAALREQKDASHDR